MERNRGWFASAAVVLFVMGVSAGARAEDYPLRKDFPKVVPITTEDFTRKYKEAVVVDANTIILKTERPYPQLPADMSTFGIISHRVADYATTKDFASGKENVNLQDVMINLQKANLSFQQMVQVRNKLVTAYHDVMNMPV